MAISEIFLRGEFSRWPLVWAVVNGTPGAVTTLWEVVTGQDATHRDGPVTIVIMTLALTPVWIIGAFWRLLRVAGGSKRLAKKIGGVFYAIYWFVSRIFVRIWSALNVLFGRNTRIIDHRGNDITPGGDDEEDTGMPFFGDDDDDPDPGSSSTPTEAANAPPAIAKGKGTT